MIMVVVTKETLVHKVNKDPQELLVHNPLAIGCLLVKMQPEAVEEDLENHKVNSMTIKYRK